MQDIDAEAIIADNQSLREERDRLQGHVSILLRVIDDYQKTVARLSEKRARERFPFFPQEKQR